MFSYFSTGSFLGNTVLGLVSDMLPMRSPLFEVGILTAGILGFLLTSLSSETQITVISFFLGATLFGSQILIVAIECDIGNFIKDKY